MPGAIAEQGRTGGGVLRNENGLGESFLFEALGGGDNARVVSFGKRYATRILSGALFQMFDEWVRHLSRPECGRSF
jgi:hypothetical protein